MWTFLYVGMVFGSTVTSTHPTLEDCIGRKLVLEKIQVNGTCFPRPSIPIQKPGMHSDDDEDAK